MHRIGKAIQDNPIVAAVKDITNVDRAAGSSCDVIFMLCGSILNMDDVIRKIKSRGKYVCIHMDFIEGLGRDAAAVRFIKNAGADGIITTKPSLIKEARACGIYAIQRLFMLDSRSLDTGIKSIVEERPNAVEIMPGSASRVIQRIHKHIDIPVIAGGLIFDKHDIMDALSRGAVAVSTSSTELWEE